MRKINSRKQIQVKTLFNKNLAGSVFATWFYCIILCKYSRFMKFRPEPMLRTDFYLYRTCLALYRRVLSFFLGSEVLVQLRFPPSHTKKAFLCYELFMEASLPGVQLQGGRKQWCHILVNSSAFTKSKHPPWMVLMAVQGNEHSSAGWGIPNLCIDYESIVYIR
jgi:hypothetical protein